MGLPSLGDHMLTHYKIDELFDYGNVVVMCLLKKRVASMN